MPCWKAPTMADTAVICPGNASEAKECVSTSLKLKQGKYWLLYRSVDTDGILHLLTLSPKFQGLITLPPHSDSSGLWMDRCCSYCSQSRLFGYHGIEWPGRICSHFKENLALYLTSFFYLLTTLIRSGRGKANKTGRTDYLHSCKRFLSDWVEWIEPYMDCGSRGCLSFTFMDALSTASIFIVPFHSILHQLLGHELRPGSQAAEDQDCCGYVTMQHPKDKPYSDSVKPAQFWSQPHRLPEKRELCWC